MSGPAGVSAGIYAASRGKKTLLIEKKRIGGIIGNVSTVTHYTAIMQPETGESFATRMWNQIKNCGVEIINEEVVSTSLKGDVKSLTTDKNTYSAKKVIIAAGSTPRKLDIEGEKPLDGKYIYLNAAKDGERFKGKNIYSTKEELLKKLEKNEFLIDDLIGLKAFDNEENYIGKVVEIQKTPANDILCIKSEHKKEPVLIPFVSELVPIVDIKTKKVIIKPIGGLI